MASSAVPSLWGQRVEFRAVLGVLMSLTVPFPSHSLLPCLSCTTAHPLPQKAVAVSGSLGCPRPGWTLGLGAAWDSGSVPGMAGVLK